MAATIWSAISGVALGIGAIVGIRSGTEEPAYRIVATVGPVEIRDYGPRIAAETTVSGDEIASRSAGFQRLAGYIFGGNHTKSAIAMTAPVAQSDAGASETIPMTAPVAQQSGPAGDWTIRFYMPASYTISTLPIPNDPQVRLVPVPAAAMAVYRFSGPIGAEAVAGARETLLRALGGSAWAVAGEPVSWFYDPPWTLPPLRRNEVVVAVRRRPA